MVDMNDPEVIESLKLLSKKVKKKQYIKYVKIKKYLKNPS